LRNREKVDYITVITTSNSSLPVISMGGTIITSF
jgi:hypothetical protein